MFKLVSQTENNSLINKKGDPNTFLQMAASDSLFKLGVSRIMLASGAYVPSRWNKKILHSDINKK